MTITKEYLREIYYKNNIHKAAGILEITVPTLYEYLKNAGIPRKGCGNNGRKERKVTVV